MKRFIAIVLASWIILVAFPGDIFSQQMQDVVYLKNGSIIRGMIIEQVPGTSLKIQTSDGSVFAYAMDQVERITKEAPKETPSGPAAGRFGISGHIGTDVSGGLGFGGGLAYVLVPGGSSFGYEFAVDYYFHEYDEAEGGEKEYTDLSVFGVRANWLWNFEPGTNGVYFVTGVGFVYAILDYTIEYDPSVYGQFSSESYDYSSVGNLVNLGIGWTSAMGLGVRLETPMLFFYSSGSAAAFVPTFTLAVKFYF